MVDTSVGDEPEAIESVLAALGGKYAARILAAADRPRSAQEFSEDLDVPIATCYRRIEELESVGLLACDGRKTSDRGRRTKVYRRTIEGAELSLQELALDVEQRSEGSHSNGSGPLGDS